MIIFDLMTKVVFLLIFGLGFQQISWSQLRPVPGKLQEVTDADIQTGAERKALWLPFLKGKRVGLIANPTSMVGDEHLADVMVKEGVNLLRVFGPEHGFRGKAGAGERVRDDVDAKTGVQVVSLYGKHKKPQPEHLRDIDVMVFDIQDVGARFYTYISTMSLAMEACAEQNIAFVVLDRPNPNGHYVDGPVLEKEYASFVGMHPVPVVHGMTVGEYAKMVNEEGWLPEQRKVDLTIIPCEGYHHNQLYQLPVPPSPNLPNMASVYLYPSLCFFEGTPISVGRGTDKPFQVLGFPGLSAPYAFTPKDIPGVATDPPFKGQLCKGYDLSGFALTYIRDYRKLYFLWMLDLHHRYPKEKGPFFNAFFSKLAGNTWLAAMLMDSEVQEEDLRKRWQPDVDAFMLKRKKYLLYPDF